MQLFNTHHQNVLEKSRPLTAFLNENPFTAWGLRFGFTTHSLRLLEEKERLETAHNDALRAKNRFIFETSKQFGNVKAALAQAEERVVKLATLHAKQLNNLLISPDQQLLNEEVPYFNTLIQRRADYNKALEEKIKIFKEIYNPSKDRQVTLAKDSQLTIYHAYKNYGVNSTQARQAEIWELKQRPKYEYTPASIRLDEAALALLAPEERTLDIKITESLADSRRILAITDQEYIKDSKESALKRIESERERDSEDRLTLLRYDAMFGSSSSSRSAADKAAQEKCNYQRSTWIYQQQQYQQQQQQQYQQQWQYNFQQSSMY